MDLKLQSECPRTQAAINAALVAGIPGSVIFTIVTLLTKYGPQAVELFKALLAIFQTPPPAPVQAVPKK